MKIWLLALLALSVAAAVTAGGVRAEPFHGTELFDQEQATRIATVALAFMAPRILEPVPPSQLAIWGLRGLTTLDPALSTHWDSGVVRLVRRGSDDGEAGRPVAIRPAPPPEDAAGWGALASAMLRAGWDASQKVRRAGMGEVVATFFDELFNHLDPYSRYLSPMETDAERAAREGRAGVGFDVQLRGGRLAVRDVAADSPAAVAGVRPGDILVAIDGDPVGDLDAQSDVSGDGSGDGSSDGGDEAEAARAALRGDEDTIVAVTLRHGVRTRTLDLRRVLLAPETVFPRREGKLLVVRVSAFLGDTGEHLRHALVRGLGAGVRGVALDLRGNRGGLLAQAVAAARVFLPDGLVATTAGRNPEADHVFRADGDDLARGLPVMILVDGQSASAAEVFAAALADQHRAVVVGSSTVGKGLVQAIAPLPDGGSLFVTWSRVLAPLGWPIQGLGVLPQVCTSFGADAAMRQLRLLASGVQPMQAALDRHRASRAPIPPAEMLEIRAACPAAEGRDADLAASRFLLAHPDAYRTALLGPPQSAGLVPADAGIQAGVRP